MISQSCMFGAQLLCYLILNYGNRHLTIMKFTNNNTLLPNEHALLTLLTVNLNSLETFIFTWHMSLDMEAPPTTHK